MHLLRGLFWEFLRGVSRLLDPVMYVVIRVDLYLDKLFQAIWVPDVWLSGAVTVVWVIALALLVGTLKGWLRFCSVVLIALVAAKAYGGLPAT